MEETIIKILLVIGTIRAAGAFFVCFFASRLYEEAVKDMERTLPKWLIHILLPDYFLTRQFGNGRKFVYGVAYCLIGLLGFFPVRLYWYTKAILSADGVGDDMAFINAWNFLNIAEECSDNKPNTLCVFEFEKSGRMTMSFLSTDILCVQKMQESLYSRIYNITNDKEEYWKAKDRKVLAYEINARFVDGLDLFECKLATWIRYPQFVKHYPNALARMCNEYRKTAVIENNSIVEVII